jgi:acyl transferase domain-containing protein/acyl carrier protein
MPPGDRDEERIALLKRAYASIEAQQVRIRELEHELERRSAPREPLAIVGLSCRFPAAPDADAYWQMLRDGVDAVGEIPRSRWNVDDFYDPDPDAAGRMYTRCGGFLGDVAGFDADFFGISAREATSMDPQQRLLLETAWEALDRAGQPRDRLAGSSTGVFIGITASDYERFQNTAADLSRLDRHHITGNTLNAAAGRLSYVFGFRGPALAIDTACSSSLVAVHLACRSIWAGDCEQAIAGGVHLMLTPAGHVALSRAGVLSATGRCRTFDAAADGMARGEGCGVVVIRRLADALRDRDPIVALVRGTAVNQDGPSSGLTVPNGRAQEAVIRAALGDAIDPCSIGYVEAHGTATPLGDPIELRALASALCARRSAADPLLVGSVKTNIGHLEAAAGIAGLIKAALALHYEEIPRHLHFKTPTAEIAWSELPIAVVSERRAWRRGAAPRRAGVSAFGFSGTNAHVVLEEAPALESPARAPADAYILRLAARTPAAVQAMAASYSAHLAASDPPLEDICYTANTGRADNRARACVVAVDRDDLAARLADVALMPRAGVTTAASGGGQRRVAFLYAGQGAQWRGMGAALFDREPAFRAAVERCDAAVARDNDAGLIDVLYGSATPRLDEAVYTQLGVYAIECGLTALWKAWGVTPWAVLGHSVGEYGAAAAAGVFDIEDGARLLAARARLIASLPSAGAMAAVHGPIDIVADAVRGAGTVSIAARNGPAQVVIAGATPEVRAVAAALRAEGLGVTPLRVAHGFHSALMEPVLEPFAAIAGALHYRTPSVRFISTVTGKTERDAVAAPGYWVDHIRSPVSFSAAVETLASHECDLFLEIGPHPVLAPLAQTVVSSGHWFASLREGRSADVTMLEGLAGLYTHGVQANWREVHRARPARRVVLPSYPWQRERFWIAAPQTTDAVTTPAPSLPDQKGSDDWTYAIRWEDEAGGRRPVADVAAAVAAHVDELRRDAGLARYTTALDMLEARSLHYAVRALADLGVTAEATPSMTTRALAERLNVAPAYVQLFARVLDMLAEAAILARDEAGWVVSPSDWRAALDAARDAPAIADLLERHPDAAPEIQMLDRCGTALADVLRGTIDPLTLLFPADGSVGAAVLYSEATASRVMNGVLARVVAEAAPPIDRPVRVLEIGAGTGGATRAILPTLDMSARAGSEYMFTDVSAGLVARARDAYAATPVVRTARLDVEADPIAQGFREDAFDVVIAANVMHATRDLRQSLAHAAALVAPGGVLVLLEGTKPTRAIDLLFGLTDGWWRFEDHSLRPAHPLLSPDGWRDVLRESGFANVAVLGSAPGDRGVLGSQAVIVAQRSATLDDARRDALRDMRPPERWVLLADCGGVHASIRDGLAARGRECSVIPSSPGVAAGDNAVLRDALAAPAGVRLHVVDCRALDVPPAAGRTSDAIETSVENLCDELLQLVKAASAAGSFECVLHLLTRGAVAVGGESCDGVSQAPVWGIGKVIAFEHPELATQVIDLEPADESADAVVAALTGDTRETQVAIRDRRCRVARLVPYRPPPRDARLSFDHHCGWLISGGMGGLGVLAARWLAARGAGPIVLLGRHGPSPAAAHAISELQRQGAQVMVQRADVAKADHVAAAVEMVRKCGARVGGVLHAAGVLDDGLLFQLNRERFARVLEPKVQGAWNLHTATLAEPVRWFVLFSAATSMFGSAGQSNHAAANAFLDTLAAFRRARRLPALSINWGAWARTGAAAGAAIAERVRLKGMRMIEPSRGLEILEQLMLGDAVQAGAFAVDWSRVPEALAALPFLSSCVAAARVTSGARQTSARLADALADASPSRRRQLLTDHVSEEVRRVLGVPAARAIDMKQGFIEQGMDSLASMDLRNRLQATTGCTLPATLLFDFPTPEALVVELTKRVSPPTKRSNERAGCATAVDDIQSRLARRLAELRDAQES